MCAVLFCLQTAECTPGALPVLTGQFRLTMFLQECNASCCKMQLCCLVCWAGCGVLVQNKPHCMLCDLSTGATCSGSASTNLQGQPSGLAELHTTPTGSLPDQECSQTGHLNCSLREDGSAVHNCAQALPRVVCYLLGWYRHLQPSDTREVKE
jgi:hypothetical protein